MVSIVTIPAMLKFASLALVPTKMAFLGRSSRIFFKKGLGRRGKGPEKAHGEPVTKSNSVALDLEAPSLRDISSVRLRSKLGSRLSSSMLALRPEPASGIRVRDRQIEIFNSAAL